MRTYSVIICVVTILTAAGCETVHQTSKTGGTHIGKGVRSVGGVTEGAAEGVQGEVTTSENPYGR